MSRDQRRGQLDAAQSFVSGAPQSFKIPVDSVYKSLHLSLELAYSTGALGALTLASPPWDCIPWTMIKRIELVADGGNTIKSYDGATMVDLTHIDYGSYPDTQIASLGASANLGTAAFPMWHVATIDLQAKGMVQELDPKTGFPVGGPQSTFLDARKFTSLELRITWGTGLADVFATVTAPNTLDLARVTPFGHEILDLDPSSTFAVNQEYMTSTAFPTNTATEREFILNTGNAYRGILLSTRDSNARAVVDRMQKIQTFENGSFRRRVMDAGFVKALVQLQKQLQSGLGVGNNPTYNPAVGTASGRNAAARLGLYYLDLAEDGRVGSMLDTRNYSSFKLLLDYDGANTTDLVRITSRLIIPNLR